MPSTLPARCRRYTRKQTLQQAMRRFATAEVRLKWDTDPHAFRAASPSRYLRTQPPSSTPRAISATTETQSHPADSG